jgi:hypothetical protein
MTFDSGLKKFGVSQKRFYMNAIRSMIARALLRLAVIAAPADQAEAIALATQPFWTQGGGGPRPTRPK